MPRSPKGEKGTSRPTFKVDRLVKKEGGQARPYVGEETQKALCPRKRGKKKNVLREMEGERRKKAL